MTASLQCPKCKTPLTEAQLNLPDLTSCPGCSSLLQVVVFPALFRRMTPGRDGEALVVETEASCFYHPAKKALRPCESCGRFVCALCDCELHGEHFCPTCLETGKTKGKIKKLENTRTLYDSIALTLAVLPTPLFYVTILTAPISLYIALRYWNAPRGILHRTRVRLILAVVFASLQMVGWGFAFYFLAKRSTSHA